MRRQECIQGLLDRLAAGDESNKEEQIKHSMERLRRLTRNMLRENQAVRRWNETDDVFQNALIRLNRALQTERPESTRRSPLAAGFSPPLRNSFVRTSISFLSASFLERSPDFTAASISLA